MAKREVVVEVRLQDQQGLRELGRLETETKKYQRELRTLNAEIQKNGQATAEQEKQVGILTAKIGRNRVVTREMKNELNGATAAGLRFRDKMADAAKAGLGAFGLNILGVTGAVYAATRAIKGMADVVVEFDQAIANIRALGGEYKTRIDDIAEAAKTAGINFGFTAKQSLDAVEALAKAGLTVEQILGGGLKGALTLAAAGEVSVGDAAETAAKAMTQFGLAGEDVGHLADLLSAGAAKAVGNVSDLNEALKFAGLTAAQFNISIDDTVGTLTAFAQNGLLGAEAGTSLQRVLLALADPSKEAKQRMEELGIQAFDAQGKFVGLAQFAGQLQDKLKGLTDEQRNATLAILFGQRGIRGANILYKEGEQSINDYTKAINQAGYAEEVAAEKTNSLEGYINKAKAAWIAFVTSIEDGDSAIGKLVKGSLDLFAKALLGIAGKHADEAYDTFLKKTEDFRQRVRKEVQGLGGDTEKFIVADLDRYASLVDAAVKRSIDSQERLVKVRAFYQKKVDEAEKLAQQHGGDRVKYNLAIARAQLALFDEEVAAAQKKTDATQIETDAVEVNTKATQENTRARRENLDTLQPNAIGVPQANPLPVPTPSQRTEAQNALIDYYRFAEIHRLNNLEGIRNDYDIQLSELDASFAAGLIAEAEYQARRRALMRETAEYEQALHLLTVQEAGNLFSALSGLAKENSDTQKAFAILAALANTYVGVTKALSELPPPVSYVAAAATLAQGLAAVNSIRSASAPGYAEGGYTKSGSKHEVAGNVHAGEWVAPAWQVNHSIDGALIAMLEERRKKRGLRDIPFASGGYGSSGYQFVKGHGGIAESTGITSAQVELVRSNALIQQALDRPSVVDVVEINKAQGRVRVQETLRTS